MSVEQPIGHRERMRVREQRMRELADQGLETTAIAARLGMSRHNAGHKLRRMGLTVVDGRWVRRSNE